MKIAILYDAEGWAQHRHALGLQKYAPPGYDVQIGLLGHTSAPLTRWADVIYTIYVASAHRIPGKKVATCAAAHTWMFGRDDPELLTNLQKWGVSKDRNSAKARATARQVDSIICRNTMLEKWFSEIHPRVRYIPAGVDTELFYPKGFNQQNEKLRVGWCGQTSAKNKGYEHIFRPLAEKLGNRYEWCDNTLTAKTARNQEDMRRWYQSLDVFLCTAAADGTPNPPFEAAACGAAVISTRCGQVADWGDLNALNMVTGTYRNHEEAQPVIDQFAQRLELLENPDILTRMRRLLHQSIELNYAYCRVAPITLDFISGK